MINYLDEVARQGSIRKASKVLHVASSAVNRQILKLEESFPLIVVDGHSSQWESLVVLELQYVYLLINCY